MFHYRKKTHLRPVIGNVTRWSRTYEMIRRYEHLKEFISNFDRHIINLMPSAAENLVISNLLETGEVGVCD